jgi:hypothetical protein
MIQWPKDTKWVISLYLLPIVSSVLLQCMPSDYPFGILWPLYRLSYFDLCLLITPLVSFGHCIVCPTLIYDFWLPHWYLLAIVSSVVLQCMSSDYPFVICWPLYRLSYFDLSLLITPLVSFVHCIVCPSLIYAFWLSLWYLLAIVLATRYQRGNQKASIEEGQTIQWPKDTEGIIRRHKSK